MIDNLLKGRSYLGCISSALALYNENIATIAKKVWGWCILLAFITGLWSVVQSMVTNANPATGLLLAVVSCIIVFLVELRIKSAFFSLIDSKSVRNNFAKLLKASFVCICTTVIAAVVCSMALLPLSRLLSYFGCSNETTQVLIPFMALALVLAITFFVLPLSFSFMKYMLEETSIRDAFLHNYRIGLRRVGFLFALFVIVVLITTILSLLFVLPNFVIATADALNDYGVTMGDSSSLPSYFGCLRFVSTALFSIFCEGISFWTLLVMCYAYGNIKAGINGKAGVNEK